MAIFGKDRFGMKLDTFNFVVFMSDTHNLIDVINSPGPCAYLESRGQSIFLNYQRVIASGFKWVGKVSENPFVVVMNERSLAVHYLSRVNYFPPKRLTDALMTQTYT